MDETKRTSYTAANSIPLKVFMDTETIKQIKNTLGELVEMMKAAYDFEDA